MKQNPPLITAALASILLGVFCLAACDKPPTSSTEESTQQASESTAETSPDTEMTSTNLPGVDEMPASTKARLDEALAAKKNKKDPTYETKHKTEDGQPIYTNRLILSSNPYLQQHAHNPTNWFLWGEEAFEKAKRENKPVLLSVGYSTCHWCHVMAKESFDDKEIAEYLNEHYVTIKVDREQRPDIDDRYMSAVRMMSGGGGATSFPCPRGCSSC